MIEHKFPLEITPADLEPWLCPDDVAEISPLPGWHNSIYRVDTRSGESFVLRVHVPDESPEFVEPTLQIAAAYARVLPFVPPPVRTQDRDSWTLISGRTATLWPYVSGVVGDEANLSKTTVARCLAEIHNAGISGLDLLHGPEAALWSRKGWRANTFWNFNKNSGFLLSNADKFDVGLKQEDLIDLLGSTCDEIQAALGLIDAGQMVTLPVHGDFYPNNLLADSTGQIVAVVDWDEARIDWRTWDVANALLEFCAGPAGMNFDQECASKFLATYESAGSPLTRTERSSLPLLIRARKLDEFMYSIAETFSGAVEDWQYLNSSLTGWLQIQSLEQF